MKFFNLDCHISVIADIKNVFESLGHTVDTWSISGHRWVFNLPACPSMVINENNWQSIDGQMVENFYRENKEKLDSYDAFICAYPPCFLKLFEPFQKPIIVVAATRYDYPFGSDPSRLKWFEDSIHNNTNLILVANNLFDKKYCEHFTNKIWKYIPSLCDYTGTEWKPKYSDYIIYSKFPVSINSRQTFIHQSSLGRYTWEDLYKYSGIVHFPYNVSTMSIFEQSNAGVPLFFPTIDWSIELINQGVPLFSEIVFPNIYPERQAQNFLTKEWIGLSDFYSGIISASFFDKGNISCLKDQNIKKINNKELIYSLWSNILSNL